MLVFGPLSFVRRDADAHSERVVWSSRQAVNSQQLVAVRVRSPRRSRPDTSEESQMDFLFAASDMNQGAQTALGDGVKADSYPDHPGERPSKAAHIKWVKIWVRLP